MSVHWKLGFVKKLLDADLGGRAADVKICGVATDSRTITAGELFVALRGAHFDGHDFVPAAAARGATAVVVDRDVNADVPLLRVNDTLAALRKLAAARRREFAGPVVALTGSCGKTTTKDMTGAVLARRYAVRVSPANYNNEVGVPLAVLALDAGDGALVLEIGVSAPGDMAPLAEAAAPTVAVITNVGPTHLEFFGDVAAVRREKMDLLHFLAPGGLAVLNADDPLVASMAAERVKGFRVVTFGIHGAADVRADDLTLEGLAGSRFWLGGATVRLTLPGEYNVANALAAAAVGRALGVGDDDIAAALGSYVGGGLRSAVAVNGRGVTYFVDCYNASPLAVKAALAALAAAEVDGRAVAVLGDMLELGAASETFHRAVGRYAYERRVALLVGVGEGGRLIVEGARAAGMPAAAARSFATREELVRYLNETLAAGDAVLLKASRRVRLEEILSALGVNVK